jgi:hypothetical protein
MLERRRRCLVQMVAHVSISARLAAVRARTLVRASDGDIITLGLYRGIDVAPVRRQNQPVS